MRARALAHTALLGKAAVKPANCSLDLSPCWSRANNQDLAMQLCDAACTHHPAPSRWQGATAKQVMQDASRPGLALVYQNTEAVLACDPDKPAFKVWPGTAAHSAFANARAASLAQLPLPFAPATFHLSPTMLLGRHAAAGA
jgi:hypothetical protein